MGVCLQQSCLSRSPPASRILPRTLNSTVRDSLFFESSKIFSPPSGSGKAGAVGGGEPALAEVVGVGAQPEEELGHGLEKWLKFIERAFSRKTHLFSPSRPCRRRRRGGSGPASLASPRTGLETGEKNQIFIRERPRRPKLGLDILRCFGGLGPDSPRGDQFIDSSGLRHASRQYLFIHPPTSLSHGGGYFPPPDARGSFREKKI